MKDKSSWTLWSARILGVGICAFLTLFALDAWDPSKPVSARVAETLIHLVPSMLVLALLVLSWRRQWIGGFAFVGLAIAYAVMVRFRLDWVVVISGPLLVVGMLFLRSKANESGRRAPSA